MSTMEEISVVKEELAEKQQALEALQRNFDDFQESSRELEEELEAELGRVSGVGELLGVFLHTRHQTGRNGPSARPADCCPCCGCAS